MARIQGRGSMELRLGLGPLAPPEVALPQTAMGIDIMRIDSDGFFKLSRSLRNPVLILAKSAQLEPSAAVLRGELQRLAQRRRPAADLRHPPRRGPECRIR